MIFPLRRIYFVRGIQIGPIQARELTSAMWGLHLHAELGVVSVESHGTVGGDDQHINALIPLVHIESMEPDADAQTREKRAAKPLPPVTDSVPHVDPVTDSVSPSPATASSPPSRPPGRPRTKRMGVE